jgi:hypothetical protein
MLGLSLHPQEDNHSYYVSRVYGPGEPRSRELWVDVASANQSQVKVHRILSNTHRQASVSSSVPSSAAGAPRQLGCGLRFVTSARIRASHLLSYGSCPEHACPHSVQTSMGQCGQTGLGLWLGPC